MNTFVYSADYQKARLIRYKDIMEVIIMKRIMFTKPKTQRDRKYTSWISQLPCLVCGIQLEFSDPHHTETGGKGLKASDYTQIPLCHSHHLEVHQIGKQSFAKKYGLDYKYICERLIGIWETLRKGI